MLVVGKRVFPWMLRRVALLGSRELFTLCVLAIAIGIAYGAGAIFSVSYALGAFFAGMVMRESSFAHRAARNCLPLQDAFSVLFFISVGLMLDLHVFVNEPFAVLAVVFIIMFITSSVSALLVLLLGWPLDTALVMGACVSQLGEFSFILCGQGITLGIASPETMSIVVAASIITIAVNPLMFQLVPHVKRLLVTRYPYFRRMADRVSPLATGKPKTTKGHVLIAGVNEVVLTLLPKLERRGIDFTCFVSTDEAAAAVNAYEHGSAIVGDPSDPEILDKGHIHTAQLPDSLQCSIPGKSKLHRSRIAMHAEGTPAGRYHITLRADQILISTHKGHRLGILQLISREQNAIFVAVPCHIPQDHIREFSVCTHVIVKDLTGIDVHSCQTLP